MELKLREPVPGDIGWMISMHGTQYAEQFRFDTRFERDIAHKAARFFEQRNDFNRILIAEMGGDRAGTIAVSLRLEQTAFINFLLVLPEYRGHGVARRMVADTLEYARDYGLKQVRLETYSCLTAARELYRQFGFKRYQSIKNRRLYGQTFDQEFWERAI